MDHVDLSSKDFDFMMVAINAQDVCIVQVSSDVDKLANLDVIQITVNTLVDVGDAIGSINVRWLFTIMEMVKVVLLIYVLYM